MIGTLLTNYELPAHYVDPDRRAQKPLTIKNKKNKKQHTLILFTVSVTRQKQMNFNKLEKLPNHCQISSSFHLAKKNSAPQSIVLYVTTKLT